jgi:iron complex outermembrane receptor protein
MHEPLPARALARAAAVAAALVPVPAAAQVQLQPLAVEGTRPAESLTVPTTDAARAAIERTPGAVSVVPDTAWADTPAATLKDVLDYTPGVFVQPKWGEDSRLSIRGSGLSRNFHMRGVAILQDGVPISASDGSSDFQELDPTGFRYVEVYKGANALRYGANYVGGAINFVSPSGYDAERFQGRADFGSFGFRRLQGSSGGNDGTFDGYVTGSWQAQDGFRDHSAGHSTRAAGNLGIRLGPDIETRFYFNATDIRQEIPGSVTKQAALHDPRRAAAGNLAQDYHRNMQSWRVANKASLKLGATTFEVGGYVVNKDLLHPIFQYLDYEYRDFGGLRPGDRRAADRRPPQPPHHRGQPRPGLRRQPPVRQRRRRPRRAPLPLEGRLAHDDRLRRGFLRGRADVSLVAGAQYVKARRKRDDRFPDATDTSGRNDYDFLNPKLGVLWQVDPGWQVFANVARSGEAPTFGELNFTNVVLAETKAQKATTLRGRHPRPPARLFLGSRALPHAVAQRVPILRPGRRQLPGDERRPDDPPGIEAGGGWAFARGLFAGGSDPDRLWLNAAYTFSDFRFDGDRDWGDNRLPGAPRHFLRAELLYRNPQGFHFGPNVEWVPEAYYVDNANSVKTETYALLGFRAGWDVDEHVSLFLDGRNLLDRKYTASASVAAVATPASSLFEPGTGAAVYGGVRLRR